jgi:hypothetical protein
MIHLCIIYYTYIIYNTYIYSSQDEYQNKTNIKTRRISKQDEYQNKTNIKTHPNDELHHRMKFVRLSF